MRPIAGEQIDIAKLGQRARDRVTGIAREDIPPIADAIDFFARVAGRDEESHERVHRGLGTF